MARSRGGEKIYVAQTIVDETRIGRGVEQSGHELLGVGTIGACRSRPVGKSSKCPMLYNRC